MFQCQGALPLMGINESEEQTLGKLRQKLREASHEEIKTRPYSSWQEKIKEVKKGAGRKHVPTNTPCKWSTLSFTTVQKVLPRICGDNNFFGNSYFVKWLWLINLWQCDQVVESWMTQNQVCKVESAQRFVPLCIYTLMYIIENLKD